MPDADQYLCMIFNAIGRCSTGGMGATSLEWQEIDAFIRRSKYELNGWQCEQIINMSRYYSNMLIDAKNPHCKAPHSNKIESEDDLKALRERVNKQIDNLF